MDQSTQGNERDRVIAELIKKGDYRSAIALCTRDHEASLTELCVTELGDNDEAREAVQEILVATFDAMPAFDGKQSVETWLLGIAHHICARRSEARAPKAPPQTELEKRVLAALDARGPVPASAPQPAVLPPQSANAAQPAATPPTAPSNKRQLAVASLAAAALIVFFVATRNRTDDDGAGVINAAAIEGALTANITRILHAGTGAAGIEVRSVQSASFGPGIAGAVLGIGGAIRTDARTRVDLTLSDGSILSLDHDTEVALDPSQPRQVHLTHGQMVAEIQQLPNAPAAQIVTNAGRIEVLGTKFFVSAQEASTNVRVTQGVVRLIASDGSQSEVHPGEEGWLVGHGPASVLPAVDLASTMAWSSDASADDAKQLRGLGELRAKRPGERTDKDRPLQLSAHKVDVKIVGNLARTEVEETFSNDGPHELEGIYRFPLPPDAQIASLSLLVDGAWIEGGFVERDRAKKIWRGVIRNATPEQQRQQEEFIWVPGPWRDPALLEWQKGGQFELRIFPIPAHGARSVRIAYTELLPPYGRGRRYTYPLPHSDDPKLRVGRFDANLRLVGVVSDTDDHATQATSYPMQHAQDGDAAVVTFSEVGFSPAGDLTIDFRAGDDNAELRSYAFSGQATAAAPSSSREGDPNAHHEHQMLHADNSGYVAFVVRPKLPASKIFAARDYTFVVDASQSMVGERFSRSAQLVERIVREMDPRDRALVMACDSTCQVMVDTPEAASPDLAQRVRQWLSTIEPAGGSDLVDALRSASALGQRRRDDRELHVVYVGDGNATTGHRRPASIANEVAALASSASVNFTVIGIGSDADSLTLSAIARAGGGHYFPYRPGESLPVVALRMLESTYGAALRNPWLELPAGIDRVAPGSLPTIRSGEEVVVVGRMRGEEVSGDAVLHGQLAGEPYEKRIPIRVQASHNMGNAFVPTLWAQKTIESLELDGRGEDTPRIIALSKAFAVMSRHTSLLVLESEAMFKAFGVDRAAPAATWTGDEEAEGDSADSDGIDALTGSLGSSGRASMAMGGGMGVGSAQGSGELRRRAESKAPSDSPAEEAPSRAQSAAPPASRPAMAPRAMAADELVMGMDDGRANRGMPMPQPELEIARPRPMPLPPRPPPRGQWMRRVWFKVAEINADTGTRASDASAVAIAESALSAQPDSRDRHRSLVRALSKAGDLDRAEQVATGWLERDKLDPEALTYLSDLAGRKGDRDRALRLLSGVVDLRADDPLLHERLAKAFDRAGNARRACAHRVSLAEIKPDSIEDVAAAVRCERNLNHPTGARSLLDGLKDTTLRAKVDLATANADPIHTPRGELLVMGRWNGGVDLDLSLITNEGTRVSWMGGRISAVGNDAASLSRETLGLARVNAGNYRIEVSRTDPSDQRPVSGEIEVRVLDQRRTLRFNLHGPRAVAGSVRVTRESRLVASSAPGGTNGNGLGGLVR